MINPRIILRNPDDVLPLAVTSRNSHFYTQKGNYLYVYVHCTHYIFDFVRANFLQRRSSELMDNEELQVSL